MADERRKADGVAGEGLAGDAHAQGLGPRVGSLLYENRRIVIASACLLVFIVLLNRVLAGQIMALDRAAIELMVEHVRAAWLTPIMEAVSFVVTPIPLIAGIFVIALGCRSRGVRGVGAFCPAPTSPCAWSISAGSASPPATPWRPWPSSVCSSGSCGTGSGVAPRASGSSPPCAR